MNRIMRVLLAIFAVVAACVVPMAQPASAQQGADYGDIVFRKVDQHGELLGGATILGLSCTKFDGDPRWTCTWLNDYSWFDSRAEGTVWPDALDTTGLATRFMNEIDTEGSWSEPIHHCVVLQELRAPDNYEIRFQPSVFCVGSGGWTVAHAAAAFVVDDVNPVDKRDDNGNIVLDEDGNRQPVPIDEAIPGIRQFGPQQPGPWTVTNRRNSKKIVGTTFTLANPPQPTITFQKVDQNGTLLPGGDFDGWSCTKWENDLNWQCQSLNQYPWFDSTGPGTWPSRPWWEAQNPQVAPPKFWDGVWPPVVSLDRTGTTSGWFSQDIPMRGGWTSTPYPVEHCVVVREVKAPPGHLALTQPSVFCLTNKGWTAESAAGLSFVVTSGTAPISAGGPWTVRNDPVERTTVFSLVNWTVQGVAVPVAPAVNDPCNPVGVTSNVAWADALPASTSLVRWSQDPVTGARTAALVDPTNWRWETGSANPIVFQLSPDSATACTSPGPGGTPPSVTLPGPSLPATGSDVTAMLIAAFGMIAIGLAAIAVTRRRRPA